MIDIPLDVQDVIDGLIGTPTSAGTDHGEEILWDCAACDTYNEWCGEISLFKPYEWISWNQDDLHLLFDYLHEE